MVNMFKHRVAHRAGKASSRARHPSAIRLDKKPVGPSVLRFTKRVKRWIDTHIKQSIEGLRRKVAIPASNIQYRSGQIKLLQEPCFNRS